ncbi:MAG: T9SS type A sorting domain-containing protein [Bacteroidales bacterium]|nr:T9SS type A sorting domain-containing protein [Bacteroidales bacterium]
MNTKMKNFLMHLFSLSLLISGPLSGQQKPPVAMDDYASVLAGETVQVHATQNDWCMEGHTFKIVIAFSNLGDVTFNDSIITYNAYYFQKYNDTAFYRIMDLDNGLISEPGRLIMTVENEGQQVLEINNIRAMFNAYGMHFWAVNGDHLFEAPIGGGAMTVFNSTLWAGAMDNTGILHLAGERYRQTGIDFRQGPVSGIYPENYLIDWNRIWIIDRADVEYHKAHWFEPGYVLPEAIDQWPAHGNTGIGQAGMLAPFSDLDSNGIYDPAHGDYPLIRGDRTLFFLFNDDMQEHSESGGKKLGIEVSGMAYAFDCPEDSAFHNSLFLHYDVINRSDTSYYGFFLGIYTDMDIGNAWDDYIGCDTILHAFYGYNGDGYDEYHGYGNPENCYLDHPPAQGVVFLNREMDHFMCLQNAFSGTTGDPSTPRQYYNYLTGLWRDSTHLTYGGNGYGGLNPVDHIYPGDPLSGAGWSEVSEQNEPGDRRGIASSGPNTLLPGDTLSFDLAYVFAQDMQGDQLDAVNMLRSRISHIRAHFTNQTTPCGTPWSVIRYNPAAPELRVFPNPACDRIHISLPGVPDGSTYQVIDLMGQVVLQGMLDQHQTGILVSGLQDGLYILRLSYKKGVLSSKFIKG